MDTIKVICENNGKTLYIEQGRSLADMLNMVALKNEYPFLAAYVNNNIEELGYKIFSPVSVRFIDITHFEGMRVYQRTLFFVLHKAVIDLFPDKKLKIKNSVAKGFYCEIDGLEDILPEHINHIAGRMHELIAQNIPIVRQRMFREDAIELYQQFSMTDKISLLRTRPHVYAKIYMLADLPGYFYGALAPSTGSIHSFDLRKYFGGMYIAMPCRANPLELERMVAQDKMFDIFNEYKRWGEVLGIPTVGALNNRIIEGHGGELIKIVESFHEKKFSHIADTIYERYTEGGAHLVLVSGPSSSGKTTFSKRLDIQLKILGLRPVIISLDNYFVDRERTPRDQAGEHDYEALEAIDVELFNRDLADLMEGREASMPRYDFATGRSVPDSFKMRLPENSVIIIEGIHALNPALTPHIEVSKKFRVYISALTSIAMDDITRISTTDTRLLRRMVRDSKFRNNDATQTIRRWQSVRRGEDKHIFPYQEEADVMFNSSLMFEFSLLKSYAEPLLHEVPDIVPEYGEARRLLAFLKFFTPLSDEGLPPTSILREFVGRSSFDYD